MSNSDHTPDITDEPATLPAVAPLPDPPPADPPTAPSRPPWQPDPQARLRAGLSLLKSAESAFASSHLPADWKRSRVLKRAVALLEECLP